MSMFCYQCQEAAKNQGCTVAGVCGKSETTANLQDLLVDALRGLSIWQEMARELGIEKSGVGRFIAESLFVTVTNTSFDDAQVTTYIQKALALRDELRALVAGPFEQKHGRPAEEGLHPSATWSGSEEQFADRAAQVGVMATANEDVRSLRELLVYGLKGVAAYAHHAAMLGHESDEIYGFFSEALVSTTREHTVDEMVALVMKAGEVAVTTMALLDTANTAAYGNPEVTEVSLGVRNNPGILISGHDLKDMEELLEQTAGTGVDVYTHGEMLPAHYYPEFKKYDHLVGNYGGAWYDQQNDFETFGGPILMSTNCLVPVQDSYRDRIYITGAVGYPGLTHIADRTEGGRKDFSALVEQAKNCPAPKELEMGTIVGGFAHNQVLALADKVVDAVKSGAIKRFVVMAGCDGRHKSREYFSDVAKELPKDTVILTAGCAKFRYNKLDLGDIGGIPRVLDAGQCNDSYSLAVVALKLKEVFELEDINELPISFDIAWYEQKAVAVLLALLHLGVKGIRLGPTLPAFLSPNVVNVLVENFNITPITEPAADVAAMVGAKKADHSAA